MPELAKQLSEKDDTFTNIVDEVKRTVYKQMDSKGIQMLQQPESVGELHVGKLKLFYKGMK